MVMLMLLSCVGTEEEGSVGVTTASMDEGEGVGMEEGGGAMALAVEEATQVVMVVTMATKEVEAMAVATLIGGETN